MKPKPIADWTNANEYPKWNSTSMRRFAWEFLRRNPEYQKDWADYLGICRGIVPNYDPHAQQSDADCDALDNHPNYAHYDPPRLNGENEDAWLKRVGRGTRQPLHSWYANKWGLDYFFPDPFFAYEKSTLGLMDIRFKSSPGVSVVTEHWGGFKGGKIYTLHRQDALAFDFSLPIEAQLTAAGKYLKSHQEWLIKQGVVEAFPNKIARKEWVVHLRLLDADAANVKLREMVEPLYKGTNDSPPDYGGTKKVRAALKTAKYWRDSWYSLIPAMKKHPEKIK